MHAYHYIFDEFISSGAAALGFDDQALTAITQLDNISSGDLIKGLGNDSTFAIVLRCAGQTYNKSGRMSIINEFLRYRG